jgi:hypothetical protein
MLLPFLVSWRERAYATMFSAPGLYSTIKSNLTSFSDLVVLGDRGEAQVEEELKTIVVGADSEVTSP